MEILNQKTYISYSQFVEDIKKLTQLFTHHFDCFIGIMRGGVMPAFYIARILENRNLDFIFIENYTEENKTLQNPRFYGNTKDFHYIKNKNVLLVDELIETGKTLELAVHYLEQFKPNTLKIACLYLKNDPAQLPVAVDHYLEQRSPDCWIVFPWENI